VDIQLNIRHMNGVSSCEYGQVLSHTISTLKIVHWHNIFTVLSVANSSLLFYISFSFPSLVHSQLNVAYELCIACLLVRMSACNKLRTADQIFVKYDV